MVRDRYLHFILKQISPHFFQTPLKHSLRSNDMKVNKKKKKLKIASLYK